VKKESRRETLKLHKSILLVVLALLLTGVLIAATACGGGEKETTTVSTAAAIPQGGTLNVYINEPVAIDVVDLEESEGVQVGPF
jgi:hypothetical protein